MADNDKFDWFPASTADPLRKYKQPKPNTSDVSGKNAWGGGSGYPQDDIDKDGLVTKGRWPAGTKTKSKMQMRGTGAATKGKNFYPDD